MHAGSGMAVQPEMRITINYFEGYPELQADLSAFPLRARAERMRMLAALGLSVLNNQHRAPIAAVNDFPSRATPVALVRDADDKSTQHDRGSSSADIVKKVFDQV